MTSLGAIDIRASTAIAQIDAIPIQLPVRREWKWRGLGQSLGGWVIVRVHGAHGVLGLGEATPLPDWGGDFNRYCGETPATVIHVVKDLLEPILLGADPFDIETIVRRMDDVVTGHSYAKAAVEMAIFDLQGKIAQQPVYNLLGGRFRDGVQIAHMIGIMPVEDAVEEGRRAWEEGCTAFQVKGTGDLEHDLAVVRALRKELNGTAMLRLDANQGYRRLGSKRAIVAIQRLVEAGIDMIEQPTEGLREMALIREAVAIPVIADESCWQPDDVLAIASARAADAISIYVAKSGGLLNAQRISILAEAYGLPCDVNGSLESGVGNAANVHLAVARPAISLPAVIPVTATAAMGFPQIAGRYYEDDVIQAPFAFEDGLLKPNDKPGLGIELDEEKLAAFRVAAPHGSEL